VTAATLFGILRRWATTFPGMAAIGACLAWLDASMRRATRSPGTACRWRRGAALLALALSACDPDSLSAGPSSLCTQSGAQCQHPDGPLGVCERAQCLPGESPPCFRCTPQH